VQLVCILWAKMEQDEVCSARPAGGIRTSNVSANCRGEDLREITALFARMPG